MRRRPRSPSPSGSFAVFTAPRRGPRRRPCPLSRGRRRRRDRGRARGRTALLSLGVDGVAVLPVPLGPGAIAGAHGTYPLPAPATVALLTGAGVEVRLEPEADGELVTPTGAALLAEIRTLSWRTLGPFRIAAAGYGAGSRDPPGRPNVLRALVVETELPHEDYVEVLETNVDDVTGEVLGSRPRPRHGGGCPGRPGDPGPDEEGPDGLPGPRRLPARGRPRPRPRPRGRSSGRSASARHRTSTGSSQSGRSSRSRSRSGPRHGRST